MNKIHVTIKRAAERCILMLQEEREELPGQCIERKALSAHMVQATSSAMYCPHYGNSVNLKITVFCFATS